jgi:hypothetical protein
MRYLKTYKLFESEFLNEGIFDLFRKKSEDDKIAYIFIQRLKKVRGISPYDITYSEQIDQGEDYFYSYKIEFEDVPIKISKHECDKRYGRGWNEESQQEMIKQGAIKKDNHTFYGMWSYPMGKRVRVLPSLRKVEQLFNLTESVYKSDKDARRIRDINDEINPAADVL